MSEDKQREESSIVKETYAYQKDEARQHLQFSDDESKIEGLRNRRNADTERDIGKTRARTPIADQVYSFPPIYVGTTGNKTDYSLMTALRNFESELMFKVRQKFRIQNQQLIVEEQRKMEERFIAREKEFKKQSQQFLFEEQKKMEIHFETREEEIRRREMELKSKEDKFKQQELMIQEITPLKAYLSEREDEIKKREEDLN